jgi:hypothetical protein
MCGVGKPGRWYIYRHSLITEHSVCASYTHSHRYQTHLVDTLVSSTQPDTMSGERDQIAQEKFGKNFDVSVNKLSSTDT